ncbi:MAG: hypothetical protein Q9M89_01505 [Persephonella sp.]|nr:hypothetical protein [Persephonella sp.]
MQDSRETKNEIPDSEKVPGLLHSKFYPLEIFRKSNHKVMKNPKSSQKRNILGAYLKDRKG